MSTPDHASHNILHDKLHAVQARIAAACAASGRAASSVQLLAVSKTFSADDVRQVAACGQRDFGENYIQEGVDKIIALQDSPSTWCGIALAPCKATKPNSWRSTSIGRTR